MKVVALQGDGRERGDEDAAAKLGAQVVFGGREADGASGAPAVFRRGADDGAAVLAGVGGDACDVEDVVDDSSPVDPDVAVVGFEKIGGGVAVGEGDAGVAHVHEGAYEFGCGGLDEFAVVQEFGFGLGFTGDAQGGREVAVQTGGEGGAGVV